MIGSFYILYDCLHIDTVSCQPIPITGSHILIHIPIRIPIRIMPDDGDHDVGDHVRNPNYVGEMNDSDNNTTIHDGICL